MHQVTIVALDHVVPFDLAVPCEVFRRANLPDGGPAYEVTVCGFAETVATGLFDVTVHHGPEAIERANTVVLPGLDSVDLPVSEELIRSVRGAAKRGATIASICSGAFLLAATGLLHGKRATTHWLATDLLAQRYPTIDVLPGHLYVDEGKVLTSAGAAAGLDLCLHMVHRDWGAEVAALTARRSVMPLQRAGGQSQFIQFAPPQGEGTTLAALLEWMQQHLHEDLSTAQLARRSAMSVRSLSRKFQQHVGCSPQCWVQRARVHRAQRLLETTGLGVDSIAAQAGFTSATGFRQAFRREVGTNPAAYRQAFRGQSSHG